MGVTMHKQLVIVAVLCALAAVAVSAGAAWYSVGAGLIVFGVLLAAWTVVFLLDVDKRKQPLK